MIVSNSFFKQILNYLKDVDISPEVSEEISALDFVAGNLLDQDVGRREDERDELIEVFLEQRLDVLQFAVKVAIGRHLQA
jgi:hypothetical protein